VCRARGGLAGCYGFYENIPSGAHLRMMRLGLGPGWDQKRLQFPLEACFSFNLGISWYFLVTWFLFLGCVFAYYPLCSLGGKMSQERLCICRVRACLTEGWNGMTESYLFWSTRGEPSDFQPCCNGFMQNPQPTCLSLSLSKLPI
jgi:hypothetical protein